MSAHNIISQINDGTNEQGKVLMFKTSAPTAGVAGISKGALWLDSSTGVMYQNSGTVSSASWTAVSPSNPPGIYGSVNVSKWFRDAVDGTDGLDMLVVGDSNTLFYSGATSTDVSGWTDGMTAAMFKSGSAIYATPIFPLYLDSSTQTQGWRSVFTGFAGGIGGNGTTGDDGITTAYMRSGNLGTRLGGGGTVAGPSFCTDAFKLSNGFGPAPNQMSSNLSTCDYAWFPNGEANRFNDYIAGINIDANHPMGISNAMNYRVVHAKFKASAGEFTVRCTDSVGTNLRSDYKVTCSSADDEIVATEIALGAASRSSQIQWRWAGAYGARSTAGINGKFAGFLHSARLLSSKGFSASALAWFGGGTMTQIASGASAVGSGTLATWLKEARSRQIASGGSGRVAVMVHGGANADAGVPSSWITAANSISSAFRAAWSSLGYPASDLGFILMTSHVKADPDDLSSIRSLAASTYASSTDTIFVDLASVASVNYMKLLTYYDAGGGAGDATPDVHMSPTGYEQVSIAVVERLLRAK